MRIALVAPLVERTPPLRYGGTERVVAALADGLLARGHEVTLFATGDSVSQARLVSAVDRAIWHDIDFRGEPGWPVARQLAQVQALQAEFDIIHSHVDYHFFPLLAGLSTMSISTLHARLDQPGYRDMLRCYPYAPLVSISDSQRVAVADLELDWLTTIHHGIRPSEFTYSAAHGNYLAFLGRMSPEKGPDVAIRVAEEVGIPLRMGAKVPEEDRAWFEQVVQPLLRHPGVEFLGEVNEAEKGELLRGARALLFPARWPEPFGLTLVEALACGTPVVALNAGSVPELLRDGVTGFVCETGAEMAAACARLDTISRRACRDSFETDFTVDRMVDAYVALYEHALGDLELPREVATRMRAEGRLPI
jgi:glycosyltransferase involved in cell wall biosynthesis